MLLSPVPLDKKKTWMTDSLSLSQAFALPTYRIGNTSATPWDIIQLSFDMEIIHHTWTLSCRIFCMFSRVAKSETRR